MHNIIIVKQWHIINKINEQNEVPSPTNNMDLNESARWYAADKLKMEQIWNLKRDVALKVKINRHPKYSDLNPGILHLRS